MGHVVGIDELGEILEADRAGNGVEEPLPDHEHQRQRDKEQDKGADRDQSERQDRVLPDEPELLPAAPEGRTGGG